MVDGTRKGVFNDIIEVFKPEVLGSGTCTSCLESVEVSAGVVGSLRKTLALSDIQDGLVVLAANLEGGAHNGSPVIKDALREGFSLGLLTKKRSESEGLSDRKVSAHVVQGSTDTALVGNDNTTTLVENGVDTRHVLLRDSDLDKEDGLDKLGLAEELDTKATLTTSGKKLTGTSVNGISVECAIDERESASSERFLTKSAFTRRPLESGVAVVLDFVHVLQTRGLIDENVGASGVGAERPDLESVVLLPAVLVGEDVGSFLDLISVGDTASLNIVNKASGERLTGDVETVVFVLRLGHSGLRALGGDSLLVGDDGLGNDDVYLSKLLLKILQADFNVELTATSNDVLTVRLGSADDEGIRLGKSLETFDKLGKLLVVLGLDGDADDRGHGVLHVVESVGSLAGGESTRLENVLVHTDKSDRVTARNVLNLLDVSSHHKNGTLDVLDVKVFLRAGRVAGSLDTYLLTGSDGTGEDTTEGVEATLIRGGNHLGDVHHKRAIGVTFGDSLGGFVIHGTRVEGTDTVLLGDHGGRKVGDNHLEQSLTSGEPQLHNSLEEGLAEEVLLLTLELNTKSGEHLVKAGLGLGVVGGHSGLEQTVDRLEDKLAETSAAGGVLGVLGLGPCLLVGIEEVITPETLHHLLLRNAELLSVELGETLDGEGPAVETGTEGNGTLLGGNLSVETGLSVLVGGNDDIDVLDVGTEGLVHGLGLLLELKKATIDLVHVKDGLDALGQRLTKDSLGLDADTLDGVDDDESTIGNSKGSSDLRGEINVSGGIDKVDKERLLALTLKKLVLEVHGDTGRLDGNATVLLVLTGISETGITGCLGGNDTGLGDQRVGKSRLAVIDVSDNGHVTDVGRLAHNVAHLLNCEIHHFRNSV